MKKRTHKELFLEIIQKMNTYFEEKISIKDATEVYDYEISPYGYPSHQKFILGQAMTSHAFNQNIMDGKYKGYKNAPTVGEGFSHNLTPNYYITDSLAQSLFNTDTPDDFDLIKQTMSLDVLPLITVVFSNEFDLGDDVCANVKRLSILKKDTGISVQVHSGKQMSLVQYDLFIPMVKHDCCQLCATQQYFSENNLGDRIFYRALAYGLFNDHVTEEANETMEQCVIAFQKETLPKMYKFVINLLCLMTQEPEIISVQKSSTKYVSTNNKGFASQKINNVPNVHWLGADFTTRVQYSKKINTDPSDITRGKPKRSHWRRGHWHTISQGPGRLQKKLRWFQPVFIKGHKQEVTQ